MKVTCVRGPPVQSRQPACRVVLPTSSASRGEPVTVTASLKVAPTLIESPVRKVCEPCRGGSTVRAVTVGTDPSTARVNDRLAWLPSASVTVSV